MPATPREPDGTATAPDHQRRSPDRAGRPARPGRLQSWLYGLAAHVAFDAWRKDQRDAETEALRAYHNELYVRSRDSRLANVEAGWWTGPPPYGYRRLTQRVRDHRSRLRTRHLLAVDDQRAPVVASIYRWYLRDGLSAAAIARRLASDPDRYPPPIDHARGEPRSWAPRIVTAIVRNPAYTGHTVWGRTRAGRAQPIRAWAWSIGPTHPALIDATTFRAAHNRRWRAATRAPGAEPAP